MNSLQTEKDRSRYFQSIVRYFFELRGAPFFLTPKEIDILERWLNAGIPLRIIFNGIRSSVEDRKRFPGRKNRFFSLEYCDNSVQKAFEQFKEKNIGQRTKKERPGVKKSLVHKEIQEFLKRPLEGMEEIRKILKKAQAELCRGYFDEEMLEKADDKIEQVLLKMGSKKERQKILNEVHSEYPNKDQLEISEIFQVKWIKHMRRKYQIPYISPFYY